MMLRSASTPSLRCFVSTGRRHAPPPPSSCGLVSICNNNVAKSAVSSPCSSINDGEEIQRAQSAGNLEEIFNADLDFPLSRQSSRRLSRMPTLEAILSLYPSDDEEAEAEAEAEEVEHSLVTSHEDHEMIREWNIGFCDVGKMYIAAGIGVKSIDFLDELGFGGCGGGGESHFRAADNFSGDIMEDHYKNMLFQSPNNPLFLRNYANFLYQRKGDLVRAEEYYSRAVEADPQDGDILCQYATVIWELHHDKERARSYFERAVQASSSSGDSNISASYAYFLWDIKGDEDEDGEDVLDNPHLGAQFFHQDQGIMASATA